MKRPIIGATVSADRQVEKRKFYDGHNKKRSVWESKEKPVRGLYIGYRTVANGITHYFGDDHGFEFEATDHQEVWLIVEHERHNPVRCLPEDVRIGT